ncbi:MAG: peptide chain release factor N(5)-glutamine methyltransferase [Spirochaetota bacterium]
MYNISQILNYSITQLKNNNLPSPRLDSEVILMNVLNVNKTFLYAHPEYEISDDKISTINGYINRRSKKEPIAYIIGQKEFYGLTFKVNSNVLIPRPETEHMVDYIINNIPQNASLLDICTGTGCIPVSIKYYRPHIKVAFSDISKLALDIAIYNYKTHIGKKPVNYKSDLFSNIPKNKKYNYISANPPYVKTDIYNFLEENVKNYEPRLALDGGISGLRYYSQIIKESHSYLTNNGKLVLEIDPEVYPGLEKLLKDTNNSKNFILEK